MAFPPVTPTPSPGGSQGPAFNPDVEVSGTIHVFAAFDWGDEVDLESARRLVPAKFQDVVRRPRTPSSITYRPLPLRSVLPPVSLDLPEIGKVEAAAEAMVFDFAAVSVALHIPFRLFPRNLTILAGHLANPAALVRKAREALQPLHRQLLPAIQKPEWPENLSEEYIVFQLPPPAPSLETCAAWLAGLVRVEAGPLSTEEVAEALRLHICYSPDDLLIPDWAAAVLFDRDCDETLQIIEFANMQLLEFRHIDDRLDHTLAAAYGLTSPRAWSWIPFWRHLSRPLRTLGALKVEANGLFERTENVLKLVGDQYLARVYRLLSARFHSQEWEANIQRKLEVGESVYQVLSDQADTYRTELLEIIVIVLILLEIILALVRH